MGIRVLRIMTLNCEKLGLLAGLAMKSSLVKSLDFGMFEHGVIG